MTNSRSIIYCAAILMALFAGPVTGNAAETQAAKSGVEEPVQCHKNLRVKGRSNKISSIATISAVRAWAQKAKKHGEEYTIWSQAKSTGIKCNRVEDTEYYVCFASAKPCRAANLSAPVSKKAL